jgi:hypothetical protein
MATDKPAPAVWGLRLPGAANNPVIRSQQRQQPRSTPPEGKPVADEEVATSPATPGPDLVAGIQQRQAERDRLLGLCQQLRRQHRCPGRCVFTGELRRGGLAAFRSALEE